MVALEVQRPGEPHLVVESRTRDAGDLGVIDDRDSVEHHSGPWQRRDVAVAAGLGGSERGIEGLPLAGGLAGVRAGRDEAVDAAAHVRLGLRALAVGDLDLIAALEIHAAVAALGDTELDVQLVIGQHPVDLEVRAGRGVRQHAVDDAPAIRAVRIREGPTRQVLAVEQRDPALLIGRVGTRALRPRAAGHKRPG